MQCSMIDRRENSLVANVIQCHLIDANVFSSHFILRLQSILCHCHSDRQHDSQASLVTHQTSRLFFMCDKNQCFPKGQQNEVQNQGNGKKQRFLSEVHCKFEKVLTWAVCLKVIRFFEWQKCVAYGRLGAAYTGWLVH